MRRLDAVTKPACLVIRVGRSCSARMAYTVGYEHNQVKVNGESRTYTLRVTRVYRREDGQWRIVHRHGDTPPTEHSPI
jgi:ketosteroid isomerase-like protein